MSSELRYDDTGLRQLWAAMAPKRRRQALMGAMRSLAKESLETLRAQIRASGLNTETQIERGAWMKVYTKRIGFVISVAPKRKKKPRAKAGANGVQKKRKSRAGGTPDNTPGMHTNRRGVWMPDLLFAVHGTKSRRTKKGYYRGTQQPRPFTDSTRSIATPRVTEGMQRAVAEYVLKTAEKYGCTK